MKQETELTYESAITELRSLAEKIENHQIGIDELPAALERAERLITFCKEKLKGVESNLDTLMNSQK